MSDKVGFKIIKKDALDMVLSMYVEGKCPYCQQPMTRKDLDAAIVSDVEVRPCHKACWEKHKAQRPQQAA